MFESYTIEDIKQLLSKFGIVVNEEDDGITFIDNDTNEAMEVDMTSNPLPIVARGEIKKLKSMYDLIIPNNFICFRSRNKFLKYYLRLSSRRDGKFYITLSEVLYQKRGEDGFIEDSRVIFKKSPSVNGKVIINTILYHEDSYYGVVDRKNVIISGDGEVYCVFHNQAGLIVNGEVDFGLELSKDDIIEELRSNNLINILIEFYGKQFPKVLEILEKTKSGNYNK